MDARKVHEDLQRIYRAIGKMITNFEADFSAEEERARVEAEYNRISAERKALANAPATESDPPKSVKIEK